MRTKSGIILPGQRPEKARKEYHRAAELIRLLEDEQFCLTLVNEARADLFQAFDALPLRWRLHMAWYLIRGRLTARAAATGQLNAPRQGSAPVPVAGGNGSCADRDAGGAGAVVAVGQTDQRQGNAER